MHLANNNRRRRLLSLALSGTVFLGMETGRAAAQEPGDAAIGHMLGQKWCSSCHVIDSTQQMGASTGAPSFFAIARMKSITRLSLRVFLQTPHQRMPDLHLTRDEVDDLSAYILSLRGK